MVWNDLEALRFVIIYILCWSVVLIALRSRGHAHVHAWACLALIQLFIQDLLFEQSCLVDNAQLADFEPTEPVEQEPTEPDEQEPIEKEPAEPVYEPSKSFPIFKPTKAISGGVSGRAVFGKNKRVNGSPMEKQFGGKQRKLTSFYNLA